VPTLRTVKSHTLPPIGKMAAISSSSGFRGMHGVDEGMGAPTFDSQAMWSYARRMASAHESRQQSVEDAIEQLIAVAELLERSTPEHPSVS
jgi:hypothetical protein